MNHKKTCYNDILTETSSAVSVELQLPERHRLACLSPFIDKEGILRVGGRLLHSQLPFDVKCPVLLPPNHRISTLVLRHYHELGKHQGRYITHGALREAGYHLEKGSKAIKKYISSCVVCRKTRAPLMSQKMANLPAERLAESPAFTYTGLDVFGHFLVHDGVSTRSTKATKKVWAVIFTCMVSRAVHIEMIPSMDTSAMRNALQRFVSMRGTCSYFISDNGSKLYFSSQPTKCCNVFKIHKI